MMFTTQALVRTAGIAALVGLIIGHTNSRVEVREVIKEVVVEKAAEEKVVVKWRDRIVTKEKIIKPDGTIEERTITENLVMRQELQKKEAEITRLRNEQNTTTPVLPNYSVGVQIPLKYSDLLPNSIECCSNVSVSVGVRLLGPLWAEGGFRPEVKAVTLGVRYEF